MYEYLGDYFNGRPFFFAFTSLLMFSLFNSPHFFHFLPLPHGQGSLRPISCPSAVTFETCIAGCWTTSTLKIKFTTARLISTSKLSNNLYPSFLNSSNGSRWP